MRKTIQSGPFCAFFEDNDDHYLVGVDCPLEYREFIGQAWSVKCFDTDEAYRLVRIAERVIDRAYQILMCENR